MASEQAEALKSTMRAFRESVVTDAPLTLEEQRANAELFMGAMATEPEGVTVTDVEVAGRPAHWVVPDGAAEDRVVLFLHGGGYVIGSRTTHVKLVGHLAKAAGIRALNLDYRLAPEHPHPAAVTDAVAAYSWLLEQGLAPEHLAIAGDSAGGGLTMATLVALRDQGLPQPAVATPMSPWVDLEGTGESMDTNAEADMIVGRDGLKMMSDAFLAGQDPRDPLAAPLYADLTGIAPIYVQVGDEETLLDDSLRLVERAKAAGVDAEVDVFPEMQHVFQLSVGNMPEADEAVARLGTVLRKRLGLS